MEHDHLTSHFRLFKTLQERIRAIQTRSATTKPDPQKLKTIRGLTLVFISILLGWISLQASETSSVGKYRFRTWPLASVWKVSLQNQGLIQRSNLGDFSKSLQNHPDPFSSQAFIWVSSNGCMVYLPSSPYQDHGSELWTCEPNPPPPSQWIQAGSGLDGFEKLMPFLEKTLKKQPRPPKVTLNPIDPKEIRY